MSLVFAARASDPGTNRQNARPPYADVAHLEGAGRKPVAIYPGVVRDEELGVEVFRLTLPTPQGLATSDDGRSEVLMVPDVAAPTGVFRWYGIALKVHDDWNLEQVADTADLFVRVFPFLTGDGASPGGIVMDRRAGITSYVAERNTSWLQDGATAAADDATRRQRVDLGRVVPMRWIYLKAHIRLTPDEAPAGEYNRAYWRADGPHEPWVPCGASAYATQPRGQAPVRVCVGISHGRAVNHERTISFDNHLVGTNESDVDPRLGHLAPVPHFPAGRTWNEDWQRHSPDMALNEHTVGVYQRVESANPDTTRAVVLKEEENLCASLTLPAPVDAEPAYNRNYRDAQTFRLGDTVWLGLRYRLGDDWDLSEGQVTDNDDTFTELGGYAWDDGPGPGLSGLTVGWWGDAAYLTGKRIALNTDYADGRGAAAARLRELRKGLWFSFVTKTRLTTLAGSKNREWWIKYDDETEWTYFRSDLLTIASLEHTFPIAHWIGLHEGPGIDHPRTVSWDNQRLGASFADVDPTVPTLLWETT